MLLAPRLAVPVTANTNGSELSMVQREVSSLSLLLQAQTVIVAPATYGAWIWSLGPVNRLKCKERSTSSEKLTVVQPPVWTARRSAAQPQAFGVRMETSTCAQPVSNARARGAARAYQTFRCAPVLAPPCAGALRSSREQP